MCRKYIVLLASLLFFTSNCFGQSGWVWQNPLPQGNDLYSVKVIDGNTAFASGACGTIIKTINSGQNWTILKTESGYVTKSLYFFNSNTGWAICTKDYVYQLSSVNSKIIKTTDGGNSWVEVFNFYNDVLYSIEFSSIDTGFVLSANTTDGLIYKTTDGGENWNQVFSIPNCSPISSHFLNNSVGIIGTSSGIMKTINGGINWVSKYSVQPNTCSINTIVFVNQSIGFAFGGGFYAPPGNNYQIILRTTDSGDNWNSENGVGTGELNCGDYINENTGYACSYNLLIKTTNTGLNWFNAGIQDSVWNNSISIKPALGVIVGGSGIVFTSADNGSNWIDNFPGKKGTQEISSIKFLNKNYGFAAAGSQVLKTTNGGLNWSILNTPAIHSELTSISLVDSNIIYVADGSDIGSDIIKSTNGGNNWVVQYPNIATHFLSSVYFINPDTGFYCGNNVLSKTTNGGINWNSYGINGFLNSISFVDNNTGFLIGGDYSYKTVDGGNSWFSIPVRVNSVFFVNSQTGYVAWAYMKIQKTTNGGSSWITQTSISEAWRFYEIHFINEQTGYAVGDFGVIAKTTNGGNNWINQNSPTNNTLLSVYVTDTNECFIAGINNAILKTTTGGNLVGIKSINDLIPAKFSLYQNYPNPFNPQTKIKFIISKQSFAKLIIYDILGREVATLVNEELKPGTYSFDWDGSNYASGIYFYQLAAGDYVQTKKMVLLK